MTEKQPHTEQRFGSRGEYLVALQVLLMAAFVMAPAWPPLPVGSAYPDLARWFLGSLCWASAAFFGMGGLKAIRRYLTPLPYPVDDNRLVETGAYRLVRHPLYTSIMLAFAGWTLFTASLVHAALTMASYLFFRYKASREELWLTELHPEYPDYASRTGRFFPLLQRKRRS